MHHKRKKRFDLTLLRLSFSGARSLRLKRNNVPQNFQAHVKSHFMKKNKLILRTNKIKFISWNLNTVLAWPKRLDAP